MSDLPRLPARPRDGHKGTFGTVGVVGGCCARDQARMLGAPALAARAALRAGAGLAKIAAPDAALTEVVALCPSATGIALPTDAAGAITGHGAAEVLDGLAEDAACLVVGPGLGRGAGVDAVTVRAAGQDACPAVLDADALNALAALADYAQDIRGRVIVTPHPGEFRRLADPLKIAGDPTDDAARPHLAERLAQALGCVVVLKGARTVVSDGHRTWTCERGHPCLGTAGSGDVLSGLLGGLVAQFVPAPPIAPGIKMPVDPKRPLDLFQAACVGVQAHAIAGERWAADHDASAGLLAQELADELPAVIEAMRGA